MSLDPGVVVADDILMVKAWEQCYLAFDPSELLTGWVDLDALHGVVATIEFVLNLEVQEKESESWDLEIPASLSPLLKSNLTLITAPKAPFPRSWSSSNSLK